MCIGPEWLASGGCFKAGDGDGAGTVTWENTGIAIRTDEWQKVTMLVDPVTRTFELYVEDQPYVSPDPLNFRGNPQVASSIEDALSIITQAATTLGVYDPATSTFYLRASNTSGEADYTFGYGLPNAGWRPLVGDWNGNAGDGVGLYDAASSTFYLTNTLAVGTAEMTVEFGQLQRNLQPLVGSWTASATSPASLNAAAVDQLDLGELAVDALLTSKTG